MAAIVMCEKCGMTSPGVNNFMHIRGYQLSSPTTYRTSATDYMDICKDCYKKIFNNKEEK